MSSFLYHVFSLRVYGLFDSSKCLRMLGSFILQQKILIVPLISATVLSIGYRKGENGLPEIVPQEAEIVRRIYTLFIEGKATCGIAKQLTAEGIPTPSGKTKWQSSTVESILTNEKYKGDALLQKAFTVDFLTKKQKKNEGEVPQYYVENSHPAIIEPDEWRLVQNEFERRKTLGRKYSGSSIFSSRLICGECGEFFGSKVWHSNDPYRKTIWRCNHKYDGESRCTTPTLDEEDIKSRFLNALGSRGHILLCFAFICKLIYLVS